MKDIPGAFLVDHEGNDQLIRDRIRAYDLSNKGLRDWWIDAAKDVCSDPSIDGVFLDGLVKILEPAFLKNEIGARKKAAVLDGYVTMMADTRQMLGPQKLMLANILRARFPDLGLSYIKALDGTLILAATCFAAHSAAADGPAEQRPNVLFFVSDDLRPELGCYGNSVIKSPNIDRLAKRGIVFNRAYCQQAVCSPSCSSVLTGMRPDTTNVWDLNTHFRQALPDVVTLPRYFRDHGYTTRGLGKIYHGGFDDPDGWSNPATVIKGRRQKSSEQSPGFNLPPGPAPDYFVNVTQAKLTEVPVVVWRVDG